MVSSSFRSDVKDEDEGVYALRVIIAVYVYANAAFDGLDGGELEGSWYGDGMGGGWGSGIGSTNQRTCAVDGD